MTFNSKTVPAKFKMRQQNFRRASKIINSLTAIGPYMTHFFFSFQKKKYLRQFWTPQPAKGNAN
jgi:hypothetical protein